MRRLNLVLASLVLSYPLGVFAEMDALSMYQTPPPPEGGLTIDSIQPVVISKPVPPPPPKPVAPHPQQPDEIPIQTAPPEEAAKPQAAPQEQNGLVGSQANHTQVETPKGGNSVPFMPSTPQPTNSGTQGNQANQGSSAAPDNSAKQDANNSPANNPGLENSSSQPSSAPQNANGDANNQTPPSGNNNASAPVQQQQPPEQSSSPKSSDMGFS